MKKASQIVFLVDVDCMIHDLIQARPSDASGPQRSTSSSSEILTNATVHQICLRFLSYFAAQHCVSGGGGGDDCNSNSTLVKWGYKFYRSRSTRPVHQRYQFKDLDSPSLTQFAADLDDQLRRNVDVRQPKEQSAATVERAIRELICDFPWDSPYISSPVKLTRNCSDRSNDGSSTVDNYVILISKLPSSSDELCRFLATSAPASPEGNNSWPTAKQILECLAPQNVRQLMCNVAKIRLLWLDVLPFSYNSSVETQYDQQLQHSFELVHEALTNVGGGIVPLGAVLLHDALNDGFGKTGATCHRFHFPESYRLRVPFAAVLSVYSNYNDITHTKDFRHDAILEVPSPSIDDGENSKLDVQLLSLFGKITCPHESNDGSTNGCACGSHPRVLKAIGTMRLADMRSNLPAETKVYICCPNKTHAGFGFQDLLDDLATEYKAMVVSSETSSLGILIPANDDSCIAVLYMILGKAQYPMDFSNNFSNDVIVDLVFKLMTPWEVETDDGASGTGSADFLNRWLHGENDSQCKMNKEEEELIRKLQRSNRSFDKPLNQYGHRRQSPRLLKSHWQSTGKLERSSKMVDLSKSLTFDLGPQGKSMSKTNGELALDHSNVSKEIQIKDLPNEAALLFYIKTSYDTASQGDKGVVDVARDIVRTVGNYYQKRCKVDRVRKSCKTFLVGNLFQSAKDLSSKHSKSPDIPKNVRIQETNLQVVMRLEMQLAFSKGSGGDLVDQITLLLRSLSFVAGPSVLSAFMRDTLIKNYYHSLRKMVTEICEELNQPLPDDMSDNECGSLSPALSLTSVIDSGGDSKQFDMPDLTMATSSSLLSQFSASSMSSPPKQHHKGTNLVRHHSFMETSHKRQIIVSRIKTTQTLAATGQANKDRSKSTSKLDDQNQILRIHGRNHLNERQDRKHHQRTGTEPCFSATSKNVTPLKREKLTTPKGHHVLKTKKAAETPVNRQVSHVTLARQRSKRKLISDEDIDTNVVGLNIVAETPEKHWGELPYRRSPRQHASSLERQASFYSSDSQSRNLVKAESQMNLEKQLQLLEAQNDAECLQDESTDQQQITPASPKNTPHHRSITEGYDAAASPNTFATSKRKARVKRNLNLADIVPTTTTTTTYKGDRHHRSARIQLFEDNDAVFEECPLIIEEDVAIEIAPTIIAVTSDEQVAIAMSPTSVTVTSDDHVTIAKSPASIAVSSEEDVVPSKTENETQLEPLCCSSKEEFERTEGGLTDGIACVMSSPLRNGYDSPTEIHVTDSMPFPKGPLSFDNSDDNWSRSSSPRIPLLAYEVNFKSLEHSSEYDCEGGSVWSDDDDDDDDDNLLQGPEEKGAAELGQTTNGSSDLESSYHIALENAPAGNSQSEDACSNSRRSTCLSSLNGNCSDDVVESDVEPDTKKRRLESPDPDDSQPLICSTIVLTNDEFVIASQCKLPSPTQDGDHVPSADFSILASNALSKCDK